jgi:hypothetical protein
MVADFPPVAYRVVCLGAEDSLRVAYQVVFLVMVAYRAGY